MFGTEARGSAPRSSFPERASVLAQVRNSESESERERERAGGVTRGSGEGQQRERRREEEGEKGRLCRCCFAGWSS
eukprot:2045006-Rhodomonas_salina.1